MNLKKFLHYLLQQRVYLLLIFGAVFFLSWLWRFGAIISLIFLELILRLLLRCTYGKNYRYSLYNYFLIDDPIYGNRFRPNISAPKIDFLICDKYVFQHGVKPSLVLTENKSQRVKFSINSLGFRGPEFLPQKAPGISRIFCVGGSTTAGNSVDDNQTWPAQLESFLKAKGQKVEVINAGVQGWYSYQDLLRFEKEIVNYEPDLVLISQGWNEEFIYSSQKLGQWWQPKVARHFMEEKYLFIPPNRFLSNTWSLLFFFLVRTYFKNWIFDRQMSFANPRRWEMLKRPDYLTAWFDNLVEFARLAATRQIPLALVNAPAMTDSANQTKLAALKTEYLATSQKRINRTLKIVGNFIPLIDVASIFENLPTQESVAFFHENFHPNAGGNKLLAEIVGQKIIAEKIDGAKLPTILELEKLREQVASNDDSLKDYVDKKIKILSNDFKSRRVLS